MLDKLKSLARHSATYTLASLLNKAFAFILVPVYTRALTQADYGAWVLLHTFAGVLAVVYELGISSSLTRHYYDFEDEGDRRRYVGSVWLLGLLAAGGITVVLLTAAQPLVTQLFQGIDFWPTVALILVSAFLHTANVIPWVLMRVREQSRRFLVLVLCQTGVLVAAVLVFVLLLDLGLMGAVLATLTQGVVIFVFFTAYTARNMERPFLWRHIKLSLGYGLPVLVLQIGWWVLDAADRFILKFLTSLEVVAVYSVGYALGRILIMVSQAINQAWTPFFFQTFTDKDPEAEQIASYTATYFTLVTGGLGLLVVIFAREAVLLFGGRDYLDATYVTPVIALASVVQGMFYVPSRSLFLHKRTGWFPAILAVGAVLNIGLNFALIPPLGMMGAALATLAGYAATVATTFVIAQRYYPIAYQWWRIARIFIVLVVTAALSTFIVPESWGLLLAWQAVLVVAGPAALVLSGFFEPRELRAVRALLARRGLPRRGPDDRDPGEPV